EVVLGPVAQLLAGERNVEIEIEVAAERRCPWKRPAHPLLVCLQLRKRCPRDRPERYVMVGQVGDDAVKAVCDRRAGWTAGRVLGSEHEVIDEKLRTPSEEVCQRSPPLIRLKPILLLDPNPRQFLPLAGQLVTAARQFLLRLEQLKSLCEPLFTCSGLVG